MAAFTDDFTGTNGENLGDRTGWTLANGTAFAAEVNATNQLKASANEAGFTAQDTSNANHYAQAVMRYTQTGGPGTTRHFPLAVRVTDSNNFGAAYRSQNGNEEVYSRSSGTFALLSSASSVVTSGDTIKLEANGTGASSIKVYRNGAELTGLTTTSAINTTVTTPGMVPRSDAADPWIDDWESDEVSAGGGGTPYYSGMSLMGVGV